MRLLIYVSSPEATVSLHRYRVLAAMAAMADRFTVAELARYSGVKEPTVRTILTREKHRIKEIGKEQVHGRGGVPTVYKLTQREREKIAKELRELEMTAQTRDSNSAPKGDDIPRPLRVALDALLLRMPRSAIDEWQDLIDLARVSTNRATRNGALVEKWPHGSPAHSHATAAQFLLDLATAEQAAVQDPTTQIPFHDLAERLGSVVDEIRAAGDMDLAEAVTNRFEGAHPTALRGELASKDLLVSPQYPLSPPMTVYSQNEVLFIEFDLPRVEPKSIEVSFRSHFDGVMLIVEAQRPSSAPEGSVVLVSDRPTGIYRRRIFMGDAYDIHNCAASYRDGVLTVNVPIVERLVSNSEPLPGETRSGEEERVGVSI